MKLKAPDGCSSYSYNGVMVEIANDGTTEVTNNPEMVAVMMSHGFVDVNAENQSAKKTRRSAE